MLREIFTHKWILAGIAFLIVLSITCVWWYHYDTAPYKREAAKSAEFARQWKSAQKTDSKAEQAAKAPAESTTETAEKPTNKIGEGTETNTDKSTEPVNIATPETDNTEEVRVSPHGFGPYPEVPEDFPENVNWSNYEVKHPMFELMKRVRIKLWKQGHQVEGIVEEGGLLYPIIRGIVYVERSPSGKYITGKTGHPRDNVSIEQIESGAIPAGITVLDADEVGIDPYKFLNLQRVPGN